jgi:hypothetical protein
MPAQGVFPKRPEAGVETPLGVRGTARGYGVLRLGGCFAFAERSFAQDDRRAGINKIPRGTESRSSTSRRVRERWGNPRTATEVKDPALARLTAPGLETILQNLLHIPAAWEDSDYAQRSRVGRYTMRYE